LLNVGLHKVALYASDADLCLKRPAAASAYNHLLEKLDPKLSKYIDGNPIRVDGRPRASGVLDTIRAAVANGVKVPAEFNDSTVMDVLEKAVVKEWFEGLSPTLIVPT
jgi:acid phosphatase